MRSNRFFYFILSTLFIINLAIAAFFLHQKEGFHTDDHFSYGHANSTRGAFFDPNINSLFDKPQLTTGQYFQTTEFMDYLTASQQSRFRYAHIFDNLKKDVHPPLYYVILHTICSFFPKTLNKYQAGIINLIALGLTLIALYKLALLFFENKNKALAAAALFGFSKAAFASVTLLRMYALETLFAVLLIYETLLLLKHKTSPSKSLPLICLYSASGMLTQYSFIIFSAITAGFASFLFIRQKEFSILKKYILTILLSLLLFVAIFPPAIDVMLHSDRGEECLQKTNLLLLTPASLPLTLTSAFYRFAYVYITHLLSFPSTSDKFITLIIDAVSLLLLCRIFLRVKTKLSRPIIGIFALEALVLTYFLPVISFIIFFMTERTLTFLDKKPLFPSPELFFLIALLTCFALSLGILMPYMGIYDLRYFMPLMPFAALLTVNLLIFLKNKINRPVKSALLPSAILLSSLIAVTTFGQTSPFSFHNTPETNRFMRDITGKTVLTAALYNQRLLFLGSMSYLLNAKQVFPLKDACDPRMFQEIKNNKEAFVVIAKTSPQEVLLGIAPALERCPELKTLLTYLYEVKMGEQLYNVYQITLKERL